MKFFYTLFILLNTTNFLSAQTITTTVIKPPAQLRCNDVPAKKNNVVFGSIPPNSQDKPVIIFVHGWFDNGYSWFMANNKWYEETYNSGYRTAYFFHSFSDAFQSNGKVVAEMIRKTCQHYNTKNVVAMCHSKGGLDMEWALYNEGVWDSIQGVITLSTPYYGAPLIDLIKNPIIRLVTENIPFVGPIFRGQGTYQMQTSYMTGVVRPMMDNNVNNKPQKFHSFAAWGGSHNTELPATVKDDILKIIFPDYQPLCFDMPGFGTFTGGLMSAGMKVTELLTKLIAVQPQYNNPQRNTSDNDGLVPFYSAIRPGSILISQPKPSTHSYLNHIDELFSWYAWDIVKPEVEYFKDHPVFRTPKPVANNVYTDEKLVFQPISDVQLIQTKVIKVDNAATSKLYVVGNYKNEKISVLDENNKLVKTIDLNIDVENVYSLFHEIDLSSLPSDKNYILQSSVPITGFFQDGNKASVQLNISANKTYYADEELGFELILNDWLDNPEATVVKGVLSRNMNENAEVMYDKIIPISFVFDEEKQVFICKDKLSLDAGIYNLSVYAESDKINRFVTTSILMKQERKAIADDKNLFSVFPNPSNDVININFSASENADYSIEIFDVVGKKMSEKNIGTVNVGTHQIQLSAKENNLANGSYIISLNINGERKSSKVMVIN